jgi:hypothetical protein
MVSSVRKLIITIKYKIGKKARRSWSGKRKSWSGKRKNWRGKSWRGKNWKMRFEV